MEDLGDLFNQLQAALQEQSTTRLSERNVVELVNKLKAMGYVGEELLHTVNGREYLTQEHLQVEIMAELRRAGGRLPLVELPTLLGVDLSHCERVAQNLLEGQGGVVQLINGELVTTQFFDAMASEVGELLAEAGVVEVGDLAQQFGFGTDQVLTVLRKRLGAQVQGQLEGTVLYTPAHVARLQAVLRGALRGASMPTSTTAMLKDLQVRAAGVGGGRMVTTLIEELASQGVAKGSLKGGGTQWVPRIFQATQQAALESFFRDNGYIEYARLKELGLPATAAALQARFPDGIPLETLYASRSMLAQLEPYIEEAVANGAWMDLQQLLPSQMTPGDVYLLLAESELLPAGTGKGSPTASRRTGAGAAPPALLLADTCVVSAALLQEVQQALEEAARLAAHKVLEERRSARRAAPPPGKGSAVAGASEAAGLAAEAAGAGDGDDDDDWFSSKKGKKGKGGKGGGRGKGGGKGSGEKGGGKTKAAAAGESEDVARQRHMPTVQSLVERIAELHPSMQEADGLPEAVAREVHAAVLAQFEQALKAAFTHTAEERRRRQEAAAAALEAAYLQLQLLARGCGAFVPPEDNADAGAAELHSQLLKHLLRTAGADAVDAALRCAWEQANQDDGDLQDAPGPPPPPPVHAQAAEPAMSSAERNSWISRLPGDLQPALQAAAATLSGAANAQVAVEAVAECGAALGLRMKRVDKKAEKAAVAEQRQALLAQLGEPGTPAASCLALAVPVILGRVHGHVVSVPGRALARLLPTLAAHLPEAELQTLKEFHAGVVQSIRLQSSSTAGDTTALEDVQERLQQLRPALQQVAGLGTSSA